MRVCIGLYVRTCMRASASDRTGRSVGQRVCLRVRTCIRTFVHVRVRNLLRTFLRTHGPKCVCVCGRDSSDLC